MPPDFIRWIVTFYLKKTRTKIENAAGFHPGDRYLLPTHSLSWQHSEQLKWWRPFISDSHCLRPKLKPVLKLTTGRVSDIYPPVFTFLISILARVIAPLNAQPSGRVVGWPGGNHNPKRKQGKKRGPLLTLRVMIPMLSTVIAEKSTSRVVGWLLVFCCAAFAYSPCLVAQTLKPIESAPKPDVELVPLVPQTPSYLSRDPDSSYVQGTFELPTPSQVEPSRQFIDDAYKGLVTDSLSTIAEAEPQFESPEIDANYFDNLRLENFYDLAARPYQIYRSAEASIDFVSGSRTELEWIDFEWAPYLKREHQNGIVGSIQYHLLSGPQSVHLPPRLHDLMIGYQHRGTLNDRFSFDVASSVGIFSDFQGSIREGVRFPAHAVGILHTSFRSDLVFGVDYVDRDDYKIIPVLGFSWHDYNFTSLRYDLVFPRPRIEFTANEGHRYYLAAHLGGGTWDIEYPDGTGDVLNYRDYRVMLGSEKRYLDGSRHGLEIGYAFGRRLSMRESLDVLDFGNSFTVRLVSRY